MVSKQELGEMIYKTMMTRLDPQRQHVLTYQQLWVLAHKCSDDIAEIIYPILRKDCGDSPNA